ncbi:MAG: hypothetical protein IJI75_02865 [Solobacterium sp.]|nr:hypothetical protein [Solobacterium sp.]
MIVFEKKGPVNTDETARIAVETAKARSLPIVAASNTGSVIRALLREADRQEYTGTIVMVTHVYGMKEANFNELSDEEREYLSSRGVKIVTAAHALSGAERGISSVYKGIYPVEIVAQTLRMFGHGVKVCVECALMAADSGNIRAYEPVVCVGGSGSGADTACILLPGYTAKLFETKISEILCKPGLME